MITEYLISFALSPVLHAQYEAGEGWLFTPIKFWARSPLEIALGNGAHIDVLSTACLLGLIFIFLVLMPRLSFRVPTLWIRKVSTAASIIIGVWLCAEAFDTNWKFPCVQILSVITAFGGVSYGIFQWGKKSVQPRSHPLGEAR